MNKFKNFCTYRLLFGISYSLMIPAIPLFFKSIGMETITIGIIISLYGVSKTIVQIPFGIISTKLGDKVTLQLSLFLMSSIPILYIYSNSSLGCGTIYVIQGAVLGMAAPATYSLLSRTLNINRRGECTGIASAVFTLGGAIGAAIAGGIISKINSFSIVFYISSIGIFISAMYITIKINTIKIKSKAEKYKINIKYILSEIKRNKLKNKIIILSLSAFLGDYIYSCVVALIHFYGEDVLRVSTVYTSSIISIYLLVFGLGAPLAGWVSDKIGNRKQFLVSYLIMSITLWGLVVARNIYIFTVVIIIYFLGATFLNASVQSSLSEFGENKSIKGFVFGVVGASESLGYAVGPLISAIIYNFNKNYLFLGLLVVTVLVAMVYLLLFNKCNI